MHVIKVVVLGAPGCGKTSLIRRFVQHDFDDIYESTSSKQIYYPSILMDERLYELQIIDLPPINTLPRNSYEEWNHYRAYGLRNAHAYLLVFDISCAQSFQCIKSLRDQLCTMRNDPIIVIAGNKQDLLLQDELRQFNLNNNNLNLNANGNCNDNYLNYNYARYHQRHQSYHQTGALTVHENRHQNSNDLNKEFATIARKQWKCAYVECSAKFNWRVTAVFNSLMKTIDKNDDMHIRKQGTSTSSSDNNIHRRCAIL